METEKSKNGIRDNAFWTHFIPFGIWIYLMMVLGSGGWAYAARTGICLALLLWLRPWRWYPALNVKNIPLSIGVGIAVFVIWILPEHESLTGIPFWKSIYLRVGTLMPWQLYEYPETYPYAVSEIGIPLAIIRLAGSAFVIAIIEEFFWRGFAYRWMLGKEFTEIPLNKADIPVMIAISVVFGFEHTRWIVGAIAGIAYLWLMIRTRDIWAASIAHITTNLLLGVYVLVTGLYDFW